MCSSDLPTRGEGLFDNGLYKLKTSVGVFDVPETFAAKERIEMLANILDESVESKVGDEAFLERFVATIEQPYAPLTTERKIVVRHMEKFGKIDEEFAERLCTWSEVIRKTFEDDGVDEVISTRRLCHIAQTFSIFEDRLKAVQMCISRFDTDTKTAFLDLYTKIDASVQPKVDPVTPVAPASAEHENIPAF